MTKTNKKVAIIGMAFRFPSTDSAHYWGDLLAGRDLITEVAADRWALDTYRHPDKNHPGTSYSFAAGSVGDVAHFDAGFFGISPREATLMDPQQRMLLEMSWEAMENAGVKPSSLRGSACGVYIGIASNDYAYRLADDMAAIDASTATGNTSSIAANRLSYVFDLRGPSMAIDTACSSSLVAFHQACQSILSGETTHALTGGVSLHLHPYGFIIFSKASMLSKRGHCQVFDADGDGYVRSEGGGIFLLKDFDLAVADGNRILAVVAGSAVNTDGRKSGLTVPSTSAQSALLTHAYAKAGIDPTEIDYLEAHGTGTVIGDPLETHAIGTALGQRRSTPLPIGSVKSNLGHMEAASGVAGLVKALHCLQHRIVPATIGVKQLNPRIDFADLNLDVVTQNSVLKPTGRLIVGVNSFGFGGANAHVILSSHEISPVMPYSQHADLPILVSAKSAAALSQAAREWAGFLVASSDVPLYDISYSSVVHREAHTHRALVFGHDKAALSAALRAFADDAARQTAVQSGTGLTQPKGAAFVYSGNGSQWAGMGRQLLQTSPVFLAAVREVDALFQRHTDNSLEAELAGTKDNRQYERTEIAQPALFAVQVGLTRMLAQYGIHPIAVAGHSVGEVAAAWACGALSLSDAVTVIYYRSHAQGLTKGSGQMTAVACSASMAKTLLDELALTDAISIAGINSTNGITVAGEVTALEPFEQALSARAIRYKRLDLDYAFHSPAMDAIEANILTSLASIQPGTTTIPFYSSVTGALFDGRELNANYWWHNIRWPVLFEAVCQQLVAAEFNIFVEVGPHAVMRGYLHECLKECSCDGRVITTLARDNDAVDLVATAAKQAIVAGAAVDWSRFFPDAGQFVALPNYPWQREHYWHPVTSASLGMLRRYKVHPLLGYVLEQHELTWENQLDTVMLPSLADHVVGEATVFPGAGFAELALVAALIWQSAQLAEIEELEIRSPLILSHEHAKIIRVSIAAQDGSLRIMGRDQAGAEAWTTHAVARILSGPSEVALSVVAPALPVRQADFDQTSHNALTRAVGLNYGTEFQRIAQGWVDGVTALAVFTPATSSAADLAQTHLNPALLDCAFQLIVQLLKDDLALQEGLAFVPVKMERIVFRQTGTAPHLVQAVLLNRSPHSLTAEFTIFDASGTVIATIKDVRFRGVRLHRHAADHLRFLDFHATPTPHPLTSIVSHIGLDEIQAALTSVVQQCTQNQTFHRYTYEVEPLLDSLCSGFTVQALQQLADDSGMLGARLVADCQTAAPHAAAYFDHLLRMAAQDASITARDDGWEIPSRGADDILPVDIWNSLIADYPDYFQIIHSVGRIGLHLPALLTGTINPAKLASEASSHAALMRLALGESGKQQLTNNVRGWIAYSLKKLPAGQRLGVLEMSAGMPLFATDICAQLDFNRSDYTFASTSASALEEISALQEHYPEFKTHHINVDARPPAFCHLAIVQMDFSHFDEAMLAFNHANAQLVVGGSLLLIGQHPSRWMDFVFGCQTNTASSHAVWHSAQQSAQFWQQQLQTLGFTHAAQIDLVPDTHTGPYLLVAQAAVKTVVATPAAHHWLLLADESGYSAQLAQVLADTLTAQGDTVCVAQPGDRAHMASLLSGGPGMPAGQPDGIVHLAGLNLWDVDDSPSAVLQQQVDRCATAAAIIQACDATQIQAMYWIITAHVSIDLLSEHVLQSASTASLPDAALWGFGRTLMNEASNDMVRMVDLHAPNELDAVAAALAQELTLPDHESEVILGACGARYAPRLRLEPRPSPATDEPLAEPTLRLAFEIPGQLRHLRWEAHPRSLFAAHEIEVDVRATGLNFRDVMYALGMLSDEAIEQGFAGPTLGLEFAGVVTNVGAETSGYAVGDRVVGFGPSSFSNRVITQTSAIALIPQNISFAAAATIPSTFLTVYYALHQLAQLQPGEKVLIHGAAGGVGVAAIQIAKWIGAEVYATAGSDEKRDFLRLYGVEHIHDSRSLAFADEILAKTGGMGVDVVLNSLAGEAINRNFRVLKPFGRFIELGKRDFYENTKIGLRPFRNNISYFGVDADQLMKLRPDLTRRLFAEIMQLFNEGVLHPLPYTLFEANDIIDAFRYMQQSKQIGKIVVTYHQPIHQQYSVIKPAKKHLSLDPAATYLVTGGLSGFGLKVAEWLADRGARHLVLISRSGPQSAEALAGIARMKEQGVRVYATACDVTDAAALSDLLRHIAGNMPLLKGIVHAAMVIDDGLIRNMDAAQIEHVLAPKVLGALHLHKLTQGMSLDYFILFSSATTLFGNPGQGNYVAANASLEALARNRRAEGLAATCVRWGAIDDVGFLARNEAIKDALQSRMGGGAIKSAVALDVLESMLLANRSGLGVLELDWKALARFLPSAHSAKFSEMAQQGHDTDTDECEDLQALLSELSAEALQSTITDMIKQEVGEILRVAPDKIDANHSIYDMGLDSLMGVELVMALESRFGIRLSVMALSASPTISKLAEKIIMQLRASDKTETSTAQQQAEHVVAQHGAEANTESIASLIHDLQSGGAPVNNRMIH